MNKFVMLVGVPASGKSSFVEHFQYAHLVLGTNHLIHIASLDQLIENECGLGETYTQAWNRLQAASEIKGLEEVMFDEAKEFITTCEYASHLGGDGVLIWDQTNLSVKTRAKKLKMLDPEKWQTFAFIFVPSREELERRLVAREEQTGKHIPPQVLHSMLNSYHRPTEEEGFDIILDIG